MRSGSSCGCSVRKRRKEEEEEEEGGDAALVCPEQIEKESLVGPKIYKEAGIPPDLGQACQQSCQPPLKGFPPSTPWPCLPPNLPPKYLAQRPAQGLRRTPWLTPGVLSECSALVLTPGTSNEAQLVVFYVADIRYKTKGYNPEIKQGSLSAPKTSREAQMVELCDAHVHLKPEASSGAHLV